MKELRICPSGLSVESEARVDSSSSQAFCPASSSGAHPLSGTGPQVFASNPRATERPHSLRLRFRLRTEAVRRLAERPGREGRSRVQERDHTLFVEPLTYRTQGPDRQRVQTIVRTGSRIIFPRIVPTRAALPA